MEINSAGGDVYAGSEIYTALRGYSGGVRIRIVGLAASAAGVAAMAGPCEMSPTALFMLHNVQGRAQGDHRAMDHAGGICRTGDRAIASAYQLKSGMSEEKVLELMAQETWLTAQQALELGLIDGVMFQEQRLVATEAPLLSPEIIQRTRALLAEEERKRIQAQMTLLTMGGITA